MKQPRVINLVSGGGNRRRSPTRKGNSQQFNWEMYEDIDPFASDWFVDYSKRPGILVETSDF